MAKLSLIQRELKREQLVAKYKKKYGQEVQLYAPYVYDAIMTMAALRRKESGTGSELRAQVLVGELRGERLRRRQRPGHRRHGGTSGKSPGNPAGRRQSPDYRWCGQYHRNWCD